MYLIDYHIHSNCSIDANDNFDTICRAAISKGIKEISITDHYDPDANDVYCEKSYPDKMIKNSYKLAKDKYSDKIKLIYGVEAGQAQIYPQSLERLLNNNFDYVIGSIHNIKGDIDLAAVNYTKENKKFYIDRYFSELKLMIKHGFFDCVGHLDYPKRYAAKAGLYFKEADYLEVIKTILMDIIHLGRGIEVNCSGLRGSLGESMPSPFVIKLYKKLGGDIITIGSDAHHARDVGAKIKEGYELIKAAGFKYITTFENRKPSFIKI